MPENPWHKNEMEKKQNISNLLKWYLFISCSRNSIEHKVKWEEAVSIRGRIEKRRASMVFRERYRHKPKAGEKNNSSIQTSEQDQQDFSVSSTIKRERKEKDTSIYT